MVSRSRLKNPFISRAVAAWTLALYAAATAGQAIPTVCLDDCHPDAGFVISGPLCCASGCSVAEDGHRHPVHIPAECDFCAHLLPLCMAATPPELAIPLLHASPPLPGHEAVGHTPDWRGPASPRDPPSAS